MSESMIRLERKRDFTVLQNEMLRDKRLSLKTKGLFAVMLSRPGSWQFSISGLSSFTGAGRDAIRTALKELREAGYLTIEKQSHGDHGKFAGSVYVLFEESTSPCAGNPTTVEPSTADPSSADPPSENPTQVNTDLVNTDLVNTDLVNTDLVKPPKALQGGRGSKYALTKEARAVLRAYVGGDRQLANALAAFIEVREAKKAVNSERAIRMLLAELDRLSGGDYETKLLLIRQSVGNSWKGVFPLKGPGGAAPPPSAPGRMVEREEVPTW